MQKPTSIATKKAPAAIGPYSQAIKAGNFIFCSGQIALDPLSGKLINGGIKEQTEQVLANILEILKKAGLNFEHVVNTTVYLKSLQDFTEMNEVYEKKFISQPWPARATVEVSQLPKNALIEIACIALKLK